MSTPLNIPDGLAGPDALKRQYLQVLEMRNCSLRTIESWERNINRFIAWCIDRGIDSVNAVTEDVLAAYRRSLFHYRNPKTEKPLRFATQASYLMTIRRWFTWMAKQGHIETNVGENLELPKQEQRLPADVLTADEVEAILNATDATTPLGLRDRAILETFYSTAIRCGELIALQVYDVEIERGIAKIRRGKGRKDRVVPIGERALSWVIKYASDVRPRLVSKTNENAMFVSCNGRRFGRTNLSAIVRRYVVSAGIKKQGSCHLLRHTAVTLMMENGADLRSLQLLLGHEKLTTTQIYTHVSIQRLKEVHRRTHPAEASREDANGKSERSDDEENPEP